MESSGLIEDSTTEKSKARRTFSSASVWGVASELNTSELWTDSELRTIEVELGSWESRGVLFMAGVDSLSELSPFLNGGVNNWSCFLSVGKTVVEELVGSSNPLFLDSCEAIGLSETDFSTHFRTPFFAKAVVGPSSMYIGLALSDSAISW